MKTKNKNLLLVMGFIYILISLLYFLGTSFTGFVIFDENYMIIDFSNESEYIYNNNTIILTNSIKLIPDVDITTITEENLENSYVTLALKYKQDDEEEEDDDDEKDVTDKVIALDDEKINVRKDKDIFNIYFDKNLTNNDTIRMFIYTVGNATADKIYLCNTNQTCNPPGYGEVNINNEGWYNITIINLNETTNSFNIDPEKIKFDYIDALHKIYKIYNITNITYPVMGIVETRDIFINGSLGNVITNQTLNNQTVNYYFSLDGGQNYNLIETNLSHINNTLIKFKIELISDTINTPIVNDLKIDFIPNPPKIEQPPASGGSSGGGGGGGSSGGSRKKATPETTTQTQEVTTPLEELPALKNAAEPKIIKKTTEEEQILTELTGKTTYSATNMLNFIKSNLWVLIFLIALIIAYLILLIERKKIHKAYKSKKKKINKR